jgi:hexaprenyl-diphosphate synthase
LLIHFQATEYVQGTSGIERTRLLAKEYAFNARDVLRLLPDSDTKLALEALTDLVIGRAQ